MAQIEKHTAAQAAGDDEEEECGPNLVKKLEVKLARCSYDEIQQKELKSNIFD